MRLRRRRRAQGPPTLIPPGPVIVTRAKALTTLLILTVVFVAAVGYMVWLNQKTNQAIDRTDATARRVAIVQARQHRVILSRRRDQQRIALLICRKVNDSNRILADLLQELELIPPSTTTGQALRNRNAILREFAAALLKLKPQNCQQLATSHQGGKP